MDEAILWGFCVFLSVEINKCIHTDIKVYTASNFLPMTELIAFPLIRPLAFNMNYMYSAVVYSFCSEKKYKIFISAQIMDCVVGFSDL